MNFDEYQELTELTAIYTDPNVVVFELAEECGEIMSLFKRKARGDSSPVEFKENLLKEAGDVLWDLARILSDNEISLQDAAESNIKKCLDRQARSVILGTGDNR